MMGNEFCEKKNRKYTLALLRNNPNISLSGDVEKTTRTLFECLSSGIETYRTLIVVCRSGEATTQIGGMPRDNVTRRDAKGNFRLSHNLTNREAKDGNFRPVNPHRRTSHLDRCTPLRVCGFVQLMTVR